MTISPQEKLKAELEICAIHEDRLKIAIKHLSLILPLTPRIFEAPQDNNLAFLDMVTTRFAKLQDALGKKVFPLILKLTGDFDEQETFIDRLNRLERLGVIDSVQKWQELRDIRNIIAHEYENDLNALCKGLNYFIEKCDPLLEMLGNIKKYIARHHLL